jgi:hypothetical protein
MSHAPYKAPVFVVLNGPSERFVLRVFTLLMQEHPRLPGHAIDDARRHLRSVLPAEAADTVLRGCVSLMTEIMAAGGASLPARKRKSKATLPQEFLLVALIEAAQHDDGARSAEAAIRLLDSGRVQNVMEAATWLGSRLAACGIDLMRIGRTVFDHVAGRAQVEERPDHPTSAGRPYVVHCA